MSPSYLGRFVMQLPPQLLSQQQAVSWSQGQHLKYTQQDPERMAEFFLKFAVKSRYIQQRRIAHSDIVCDSGKDHGMQIFADDQVDDIRFKADFYRVHVEEVFKEFYPDRDSLPDHLIHTTCTGYVSPSPAQRIVAQLQGQTPVTHAYHMGCYAAFTAMRVADSLVRSQSLDCCDVVHTELCSLHMNPKIHTPEQIVIQTLFADGYIKYSLSHLPLAGPHFQLMAQHECIIPDSSEDMKWDIESWGFAMTLSKEVPKKIMKYLPQVMEKMVQKTPYELERLLAEATFAIHPGGPKIIDHVAMALDLQEHQISDSLAVLKTRGNMSSATLPHVWARLVDKPLEEGHPVVSFAFGPGLSIFSSIFEYRQANGK